MVGCIVNQVLGRSLIQVLFPALGSFTLEFPWDSLGFKPTLDDRDEFLWLLHFVSYVHPATN